MALINLGHRAKPQPARTDAAGGGLRFPLSCRYPDVRYKPQWTYRTPKGFRDETYLIPMHWDVPADGLLHQGFPWQLDDDVPYLIRGIIIPCLGTAQTGWNAVPSVVFPGFARIWDTIGNPLSDGLVLALGVWGQSGFGLGGTSINAFGFPIEHEVYCAPGGTLMFDFQINTNALVARFDWIIGAGQVTFAASIYGTGGNGRTITIVNPGAANIPLSIAVVGVAVTVTLATDGAAVITSTMNDVAAIVNSTPAALALMGAYKSGSTTTTLATALGVTALAGGAAADPTTPVKMNATLIGVKRFVECDE